MKIAVLAIVAVAFITGCKTTVARNAEQGVRVPATSVPPPVPPVPQPIVDEAALDRTVNPCDDFYQFSCGRWIAKTVAPKDRPQWARGFTEIAERNLVVLKKILDGYVAGEQTPKNKYSKQMGAFYGSCMNEEVIERDSLPEIEEHFKEINKVKSVADLTPLLAKYHLHGANAFFSVGPEIDFKDTKLMLMSVDQGALGLPDRDYYIKDDKNMVEIRQKYLVHVSKMLQLGGIDARSADAQANDILNLETKMARAEMSRLDRRQPENIYHRLELKGLNEKAPHFPWAKFFEEMGYPNQTKIDVNDPHYLEVFDHILTEESLDAMKAYLRYQVMTDLAPALSRSVVNENFDFYNKVLFGQEEISARWKRCIGATESALGMAIGRAFADLTFGADGKKRSQEMIKTIEESFGSELKDLAWMDAKTKAEAEKKLSKVFNKIGYPDKMRNYDSLKVDDKSPYVKNYMAGSEFVTKYYLNKIGKPVDRKEWSMTPPTVNAYYDPQFNEMVFPAGILQPPFYFRDGDASLNYGAIGIVMGHELTHGFDDQGRKYNDRGELKNWWSDTSSKEFEGRAQCVVDQYSSYTVQPGMNINGKLTLGENIADQGGVKLAYGAWSSRKEDKAPSSNGSFSKSQQFFLGFAQSWCSKIKPELERMKLVVDVHSPAKYRVNGTVSSSSGFQEAFQCKAGAPMAPEKRCNIW